jgi:peptidoglycan/xylan/chitin deacetylase (PgdA/CDA1 family)
MAPEAARGAALSADAAHPASPAPGRWPLPPLVRASVGLHLAAAGVACLPGGWPWALGAVVANHGLITATGLWPRSRGLGPNLTRLPDLPAARDAVAITVDDGPDPEVTPAVLDLLDRHRARATFFCIGSRVRAHAALAREIAARGHALQNHSMAHRHHFSLLGLRGIERELRAAQETIADVTGRRPVCFRAPAGLRNPFLDPVLHRLDLHLVSWTRRGFDTRVGDAERVLSRLTGGLAARDILLLHDGHAARTAEDRPVVLEALPRLLEACAARGLRTVTLPEILPARHELRR